MFGHATLHAPALVTSQPQVQPEKAVHNFERTGTYEAYPPLSVRLDEIFARGVCVSYRAFKTQAPFCVPTTIIKSPDGIPKPYCPPYRDPIDPQRGLQDGAVDY